MIEQVRREIARALAGVRSAIRAVQTGLTLSTRLQRVDVDGLAGESVPDLELFQQFGLTSAPPDGSQVILLPLGGRTSAGIVIATEHGTYRFKLSAKGEAALYNQWGDVVHMREDRTIHLVAAVKVQVDAPLATFSGDMHVAGTVTADVDVIGGGVHLKTHTHGNVTPGVGNTGTPN